MSWPLLDARLRLQQSAVAWPWVPALARKSALGRDTLT